MKQIKFLILLLLGVTITSCDDFLEPTPLSAITADSYFTTEAELEAGAVNMYDGIQGLTTTSSSDNHSIQIEYQLIEMRSDNTRTKSSEGESAQFESYTIESTNGVVADYYRSFYNIVYRANVVLENLDAATDANRLKYEGEAKFVRAYAYFNLVRLYGAIPLVDRVINPLETEIQFTRVATATVYELIVGDLQTAIEGLDNSTNTRASKAAAQGLLAKVYLTLGEYDLAKGLCEDVMGSGFTLEPNFKDVFYSEQNNELLFTIVYDPDNATDSQNFSAEWLNGVGRSSGLNYVTPEAVAALDLLGGNRTAYSYRIDPAQPTQNQVVKYLPTGDDSLDIDPTSDNPKLAGNDWIILRYADVLLMHAEATMAGGSETSNGTSIKAFKDVRERAGLTFDGSSITKQELLDERRVELAFENQRWFDLIRFGVANEVLSEFSAANNYSFSATALLLPIPQLEIGLSNGMLEQNPGY